VHLPVVSPSITFVGDIQVAVRPPWNPDQNLTPTDGTEAVLSRRGVVAGWA